MADIDPRFRAMERQTREDQKKFNNRIEILEKRIKIIEAQNTNVEAIVDDIRKMQHKKLLNSRTKIDDYYLPHIWEEKENSVNVSDIYQNS